MPKKFLCSDDSVNVYGFRVITSGIQLKNFKKNPVGFFNHNTGDNFWNNDPNYRGPIIRWEEIATEDNKLFATPVFDTDDPVGKDLNNKVEKDFIRAASIGFRIIETSNDPSLMEKGQTRPTITKCELMEISVVDIPANKNSLALFDAEGKKIKMDEATLNTTLSAVLRNEQTLPKNISNMKLKILAAWTALAAFFNVETGKDHEVETTPEKLAELNTKVAKLGDLETQITNLTTAKTKAEGDLAAAHTEITSLKAKVTELEAKPGDTSGAPGKLGEETITDENKDKPKNSWELKADKKKKNLRVEA